MNGNDRVHFKYIDQPLQGSLSRVNIVGLSRRQPTKVQ